MTDDICALCSPEDFTPGPIDTSKHPECGLRMVIGGIGHLIAHEYWCSQRRDPDAGLTYRQSALLVRAWVDVMGIEETVQRSITDEPEPSRGSGSN
jgi:hypothetical protein